MTQTLAIATALRERGKQSTPHVALVFTALGRLLGCSAKHAERLTANAKRVMESLPLAAAESGSMEWLAFWAAKFDALRAVQEKPLPFTAGLSCQVMRIDTAENQALMEFVAEPTQENRRRLITALQRDIEANRELLLSVEAMPA